MTTKLDALRSIRDLLSDPARWVRDAFSLTADGMKVSSHSPLACRWCLVGAIRKVCGQEDGALESRLAVYDALRGVAVAGRDAEALARFNDSSTHADVLALLDAAIAKELAK